MKISQIRFYFTAPLLLKIVRGYPTRPSVYQKDLSPPIHLNWISRLRGEEKGDHSWIESTNQPPRMPLWRVGGWLVGYLLITLSPSGNWKPRAAQLSDNSCGPVSFHFFSSFLFYLFFFHFFSFCFSRRNCHQFNTFSVFSLRNSLLLCPFRPLC